MPFRNAQATTTQQQLEAASATVSLEKQINNFISASKRVTINKYILTGVIILLTIISVIIAIINK